MVITDDDGDEDEDEDDAADEDGFGAGADVMVVGGRWDGMVMMVMWCSYGDDGEDDGVGADEDGSDVDIYVGFGWGESPPGES